MPTSIGVTYQRHSSVDRINLKRPEKLVLGGYPQKMLLGLPHPLCSSFRVPDTELEVNTMEPVVFDSWSLCVLYGLKLEHVFGRLKCTSTPTV